MSLDAAATSLAWLARKQLAATSSVPLAKLLALEGGADDLRANACIICRNV